MGWETEDRSTEQDRLCGSGERVKSDDRTNGITNRPTKLETGPTGMNIFN